MNAAPQWSYMNMQSTQQVSRLFYEASHTFEYTLNLNRGMFLGMQIYIYPPLLVTVTYSLMYYNCENNLLCCFKVQFYHKDDKYY